MTKSKKGAILRSLTIPCLILEYNFSWQEVKKLREETNIPCLYVNIYILYMLTVILQVKMGSDYP